MRAAVFLLWVALGASCAESLAKLTPFPCALDGTCPGGLTCEPGVGCTLPALDALCGPETDCSAAGGACRLGICAPACGGGCAVGRVCSSVVDGACLRDCAGGEACPQGLACTPLWYGGKHGCLPPAQAPTACTAIELEPAPVCGAEGFTVRCPNGTTVCAAHSTCREGGGCECAPGWVPWQCATAQSCGSTSCAYPNWWCLPVGIPGACATSGDYAPGTWRCRDGRALAARCGTDCETICRQEGSACDPLSPRSCTAPGATKCTLSDTDAGTVDTTCVAQTGAVPVGGTCTRDTGHAYALDDCAAGAICDQIEEPGLTCHAFCRHSSECAPGACLGASDRLPADGVCAAQCRLFAPCDRGDACGIKSDVDQRVVTQCRAQTPTAGLGTSCVYQEDCATDLICVSGAGGATCRALCDPTHVCPGGSACAVFARSELPSGTGFCR